MQIARARSKGRQAAALFEGCEFGMEHVPAQRGRYVLATASRKLCFFTKYPVELYKRRYQTVLNLLAFIHWLDTVKFEK